jgi:hypothetical protein
MLENVHNIKISRFCNLRSLPVAWKGTENCRKLISQLSILVSVIVESKILCKPANINNVSDKT